MFASLGSSSALSRSAVTRSRVSSEAGPVSGVTWTIQRSPASFGIAGETAATPGKSCSVAATSLPNCSCSSRAISGASTTTVSVPLKPGPKPSVSRSYERRSVDVVGS